MNVQFQFIFCWSDKQVFSDMDLLGWYTTGGEANQKDIDVHKQVSKQHFNIGLKQVSKQHGNIILKQVSEQHGNIGLKQVSKQHGNIGLEQVNKQQWLNMSSYDGQPYGLIWVATMVCFHKIPFMIIKMVIF